MSDHQAKTHPKIDADYARGLAREVRAAVMAAPGGTRERGERARLTMLDLYGVRVVRRSPIPAQLEHDIRCAPESPISAALSAAGRVFS